MSNTFEILTGMNKMITQLEQEVFDAASGEARKEGGIEQAAENNGEALELARAIAEELALSRGETNADEVGAEMLARHGITTMGPSAGGVFRGSQWIWTGKFVPSSRTTNHGRLLRVWTLKERGLA